jgi:urea transport system permease protein
LIPWWAFLGCAAAVAAIGSYPYFGTSVYILALLGKFLCYAIFALSIDLIWGFAGILSLGQAVYFGIGAYFVALSLKINYAEVNPTRYGGTIPDFMEWNGLTELPGFMEPLLSTPFAVFLALAVPTLLAFLFGVITFKRHIYGVYCAVITLAESLILQEFIIEYQAYTGGFNGITDYSNALAWSFFGENGVDGDDFLWLMLGVTVAFLLIARLLTHSPFGTVLKSIRDNHARAAFLGYNVANYRIFVFCVSAFMSATAGAMYAAWVADYWQLVMGGLFIFVVLIMRDGVVGTIGNWIRSYQKAKGAKITEEADRRAHDHKTTGNQRDR